MATPSVIGIDVGTTALKAVLIDLNGRRLAEFARPYPISRPEPGAAEQDPRDWMRGVLDALASFSASHDLGGLLSIGICSQVNTHVFTDGNGEPLLPAITWQDGRSAPDAATLDAQVTADQKLDWFGGPVPIDASHALSRMAYIRRRHPEIFAATRHVLLPKDYCVMQLTGAVGSDPISSVGLVGKTGYVGLLLDLVPRAARLLPPLHAFSHIAGRIKPGLPCAGTPVVVGAMDAWGGMFGVGVADDGDAMLQSGTSEIAGIVSGRIHPTPGVILFPPYGGIVMHAAPTQSGGAALQWLGNLLGRTPTELSALSSGCGASSAVPLFLPHLQGERAPLWDTETRGVFARIDGRAGPAEMARATMEGVAFSIRWAFDALQNSAGRSVTIANIGGGGSRSEVWSQIKADTLGFPLRRAAVPDSAAVGAAILAGLGSGAFPTLRDAISHLVQFDRTFEPDLAWRAYFDDKFGRYRELYETLKPFNHGYATA